MSHILEGLNPPQKEAVLTTEGPLLIIAGAGSGKTKALTHRIAYLIQEKHVQPDHILSVTFTNKAANEMKERVAKLLGDDGHSKLPMMGTFHSICVRFLRRHIHVLGYENSFSIYDTGDQVALMKLIFKEKHLTDTQTNPKSVLNAISNAKNQLIGPDGYSQFANTPFHELVAELYPIYQKALQSASALDFDDILMKTVELFSSDLDLLARYQNQFEYVCVDEYQDTNHVQYLLMKMLGEKHKNICVIGDDWQSIYSWRGANVQNILDFEKDYPDAKVIRLEQNYRSTKTIVEAANAVIKNNDRRSDKTLWSDKDTEDKITLLEAYDERDEIEKILGRIMEHMREKGRTFKDFVLLYRTNAQSRVLEEGMMRHGIPYKIVGGVKFYERKEIKDMLAYLRLILNIRDNVSFLRIINVPARKIGAKTLEVLQKSAMDHDVPLFEAIQYIGEYPELAGAGSGALIKFYELFNELRASNLEFPVSGVIRHVLKLAKYEQYLLDGTMEGEERFKNLEELISVASKYDGLEPGISLATFLEEVALVSDTDDLGSSDDAVTMMTLHSSKGLEYPIVFMVGLEDGLFPTSRSQLDPNDLEEERRLMYVGMTRAKEKLYLSFAQNRMLYGNYNSFSRCRFLDEIPEEHLEGAPEKKVNAMLDDAFSEVSYVDFEEATAYDVGDLIEHASWGRGKVVGARGDVLTIVFRDPKIGTKKIAANVAPIRRVE